ncbi:hypothetical protein [Oligoflexus tunisiensis]|uniref:hypothetical protein n=1 Tax=Oligoflexus tunisiensis TaxID=708132 RepID=UPI00114CA0E6|nr:hypothetical protein [Oligoflexus tunisiensis]
MSLIRACSGLASVLLASALLSGCSTFALSYQNYFTKNFAYVATGYDGNPSVQLSDGAESNNIENGNETEYSATEHPTIFFGFRSLEHHNSQYTRGGNMDDTIVGTLIAPGKTEPIPFLTLSMSGSNINAQPSIPQAQAVTFIKATYPALMVKVDNKAKQSTYGSGAYTLVWKSVKSSGKTEDRELSRVTTQLVP